MIHLSIQFCALKHNFVALESSIQIAMPQKYNLIACILLGLMLYFPAYSQEVPTDSLNHEVESEEMTVEEEELFSDSTIKYKEPFPFKPTNLHLGVNAYPIAVSLIEKEVSAVGFHVGVGFNDKFWIQSDFGFEDNRRINNTFPFYEYRTTGAYATLGIDYSLTYWKIPHDGLFIGLHYGLSRFQQRIAYSSTNDEWRHKMELIEKDGITASWVEPRATLQVSAFKRLSLEAALGFRVRLSQSGYEVMPNEIPGLGLTKTRARLSLGYRLCYIIGRRI